MEKQTPNPENKVEAKLEGNTLWKLPVILMSKNKTLKYDQGIDEKKTKQKISLQNGKNTEKKKGHLLFLRFSVPSYLSSLKGSFKALFYTKLHVLDLLGDLGKSDLSLLGLAVCQALYLGHKTICLSVVYFANGITIHPVNKIRTNPWFISSFILCVQWVESPVGSSPLNSTYSVIHLLLHGHGFYSGPVVACINSHCKMFLTSVLFSSFFSS